MMEHMKDFKRRANSKLIFATSSQEKRAQYQILFENHGFKSIDFIDFNIKEPIAEIETIAIYKASQMPDDFILTCWLTKNHDTVDLIH